MTEVPYELTTRALFESLPGWPWLWIAFGLMYVGIAVVFLRSACRRQRVSDLSRRMVADRLRRELESTAAGNRQG